MSDMGRRKTAYPDMPPRLQPRPCKDGSFNYYYQAGGKKIALGKDLAAAKQEWARLESGGGKSLFPVLAKEYERKALAGLSVSTQRHYSAAIENLREAFATFTPEDIQPADVQDYIDRRTKKGAALFEKRVLSALFKWWRARRLTSAPNPCSGVTLSRSDRRAAGIGRRTKYVTDEEFAAVYAKADPLLQDCMDLALLTGQRPSDVLTMTRQHIRDGALWIAQDKTDARLGVRVKGELKSVLERILARPRTVKSMYLIATDDGQRLTYNAMNARFVKARTAAGQSWQFRDIRAKAATDSPDLKKAQELLGHATEATTAGVYRRTKGFLVDPLR